MKSVCALAVAAVALGVSACAGSTAATTGGSSGGPALIRVVASTDVYGDIARTIGGDSVAVTSIIDEPDKDPHEYAGDARTQLDLSKAQVVVENGGGYDGFVDTMLSSVAGERTVVNVADLSGYDQAPTAGEFNEHLWYDFPTMVKLADQLSADLGAVDPARAATFTANAKAFVGQLHKLEKGEAALKKAHAGDGVAVTEPVPLYLLAAAGLDNKTPEEFSAAIEEGTDVAPTVLQQTTDLFDQHQVRLLAYNEQTGGPQTEVVLAAARRNGVALLPVTETLPAGKTYLTWMQGYLDAVSSALGS